jgi:uncharacterized repeat protein (TIGR01451 family)
MATTDLSITIDDTVPTVVPGETELYTIVVTNNSGDPVTGASVFVPLPAGVTDALWTFFDSSGTGSVSGPTDGTGALATTAAGEWRQRLLLLPGQCRPVGHRRPGHHGHGHRANRDRRPRPHQQQRHRHRRADAGGRPGHL